MVHGGRPGRSTRWRGSGDAGEIYRRAFHPHAGAITPCSGTPRSSAHPRTATEQASAGSFRGCHTGTVASVSTTPCARLLDGPSRNPLVSPNGSSGTIQRADTRLPADPRAGLCLFHAGSDWAVRTCQPIPVPRSTRIDLLSVPSGQQTSGYVALRHEPWTCRLTRVPPRMPEAPGKSPKRADARRSRSAHRAKSPHQPRTAILSTSASHRAEDLLLVERLPLLLLVEHRVQIHGDRLIRLDARKLGTRGRETSVRQHLLAVGQHELNVEQRLRRMAHISRDRDAVRENDQGLNWLLPLDRQAVAFHLRDAIDVEGGGDIELTRHEQLCHGCMALMGRASGGGLGEQRDRLLLGHPLLCNEVVFHQRPEPSPVRALKRNAAIVFREHFLPALRSLFRRNRISVPGCDIDVQPRARPVVRDRRAHDVVRLWTAKRSQQTLSVEHCHLQ